MAEDKVEIQKESVPPSEAELKHGFFVTKVSIVSLASIMVSVVAILLVSIFHPDVDNNKIFEILGPAFQTVVGCFVGMVSANFIRR